MSFSRGELGQAWEGYCPARPARRASERSPLDDSRALGDIPRHFRFRQGEYLDLLTVCLCPPGHSAPFLYHGKNMGRRVGVIKDVAKTTVHN